MRARRLTFSDRYAFYHVISRTVAGEKILEPRDQEVLRSQIRKMAAFCGVEVLTYCILSNHFHLLLGVPPWQNELPDKELVRRYAILYGEHDAQVLAENLRTSPQSAKIRERLLNRMHDLSFFMKELKLRFTIYFNKTHNRFGTLWAERFKSLLIESKGSRDSVLAVAAYIDLNAVRAGFCDDPKDYRFCGYAEAVAGGSEARKGFERIIERKKQKEVLREYRAVLFGVGAAGGDPARQSRIDPVKCRDVLKSGGRLPLHELLRCRVRYFSDGIALGSSSFVTDMRHRVSPSPSRGKHQQPPNLPVADTDNLHFARRQRK